jgi:hypothetical protein
MATFQEIRSLMQRADALLAELQEEYRKCLAAKEVSFAARNLTHEVLEKCANALDQVMHLAWQTRVAPKLSVLPKRGGYFPAARDEQSYRSSLGQWNVSDLESIDSDFDALLRRHQPFTRPDGTWLAVVKDLAAKKHTGLVPQRRVENRRVLVSRLGGGHVSWGSGVTFGSGVSVLGVPIDPQTQLPMASSQIQTQIEIWVAFQIEGTNLNAFDLCQEAVLGTKQILEDFQTTMSLS